MGAIFLSVVGHINEVCSPGGRRDHSSILIHSGLRALLVLKPLYFVLPCWDIKYACTSGIKTDALYSVTSYHSCVWVAMVPTVC